MLEVGFDVGEGDGWAAHGRGGGAVQDWPKRGAALRRGEDGRCLPVYVSNRDTGKHPGVRMLHLHERVLAIDPVEALRCHGVHTTPQYGGRIRGPRRGKAEPRGRRQKRGRGWKGIRRSGKSQGGN